MARTTLGMAAAIVAAALAIGCSGKTLDSKQTQDVSADGKKATQTRERLRETSSGTVVKETATRTREVVSPATMPDARQRGATR